MTDHPMSDAAAVVPSIPLTPSDVNELQAILAAEYGKAFPDDEAWAIAHDLIRLTEVFFFTS
jgi:hypothetical protein